MLYRLKLKGLAIPAVSIADDMASNGWSSVPQGVFVWTKF